MARPKNKTIMPSHLLVVYGFDGSRRVIMRRNAVEARRTRTALFNSGEAMEVGIYARLTEEAEIGPPKAGLPDESKEILAFLKTALPAATDIKVRDGLVSYSVYGHRFHSRTLADADHLVSRLR